jgi:hypothetical protein
MAPTWQQQHPEHASLTLYNLRVGVIRQVSNAVASLGSAAASAMSFLLARGNSLITL